MNLPLSPLFRALAMAGCIASSSLLLSGCQDEQSQQLEQAKILLKSASSYHEQGQYRAAITELQSSLDISNTIEANVQLAKIFNELRQAETAENLLKPHLEAYPNKVRYELSRSFLLREKHRSALEIIDSAKQPESEALKLNRLEAYIGLKDLDAAAQVLAELEKATLDQARAQLLKLDLLAAQRQEQALVEQLTLLRQNYPDSAEVQWRLGQIAHGQNDFNAAEKDLTRALALLPQTDVMTPQKQQVLALLSDTLTRNGRFTEAMVYKKLIAENNPDLKSTQQAYEQAMAEIKLGNYDKAEEILSGLSEQFPEADQINTMLGVISLQQGQLERAGNLLAASIDPETAKPELVNATAAAQLRLNRPEEALALLDEALKESPNNIQMLTLLGLTAVRVEGQETRGEDALKKALELEPDNARVRIALAQYYFGLKDIDQGLSELKTAADANPDNDQVSLFYFRALAEADKLDEAEQFIAMRETKQPQSLATWQMKAGLEQKKGNKKEALAALDKAISVAPQNSDLFLAKAQLYLVDKDYSQAREAYHEAIKANPGNVRALKGMVSVSEASGSAKPALEYLTKLASTDQGEAASAVLIEFYLRNRQLASAEQVAQTLSARVGLNDYSNLMLANTYHKRAQIEVAKGDLSNAQVTFEKALAAAPKSQRLMFEYGLLKLRQKDIQAAETVLKDLQKLSATTESAVLSAEIAKQQNKPDEALFALEVAYQKTPSKELAQALYAEQKRQKKANAEKTLADWRERYPDDPRAILEEANVAIQRKDQLGAISLYEQALTLAPESVLALNNLAWLYGEQKQMEKAETTALKAAQLAPQSPSVLDTAGWILVQNGKKEGLAMLEKAVSLAPDNAEIAEHYQKAQAMSL